MGVSDENRWWADEELRARFFDWDPKDGWYRRFFDIDDLAAVRVEDEEVFAVDPREGPRARARGRRRRPAGGSSRRSRRPGRLPAPPRRRGRGARLGREDPPPRRGAARLAGRGHRRLRVPQRRDGAVRRPGRRGRAHRPLRRADGRDARVRRGRARGPGPAGARRRSRARSRGCAPCSTRPGIADALAALPVYRTYVEPWSGASRPTTARRSREAGIDGRLADVLLLRERGHDEFVTRFQQTSPPVTAKGVEDTAFYRYVRLLALNEVGGDPGAIRAERPRSSTPRTRCAPSASPAACSSPRRTTRSARATSARGSARSPAWRPSGASTCCAGARSTPACAPTARPTPTRST